MVEAGVPPGSGSDDSDRALSSKGPQWVCSMDGKLSPFRDWEPGCVPAVVQNEIYQKNGTVIALQRSDF
jgi:hypothetical protein